MKQLRYFMFVLASLFATGVLAQAVEHLNLGLYDPSAPRDEIRAVSEQVDGPSWVANAPIPQAGGLAQTTTVESDDGISLFVIGGGIGGALTPTNVVRNYDSTTDTWTTVEPIPISPGVRAFGSAVRVPPPPPAGVGLGSKIYVFGGYDGTNVLNSTWIYDIASDSWSQGANMPAERFGPAVAFDGAVIWVIGGFSGPPTFAETSTVWQYDPATDSWTTGFAAMPGGLGRIHGAFVPAPIAGGGGGTVHVFAGGTSQFPFDGQNHRVYDTATDSWSSAALMPFGVTDPATVYNPVDGMIYLAGGGGFAPRPPGHTQIFDLNAGTWSQGPMMPAPANDNTSGALICSGPPAGLTCTFYVEGGFDGVGAASTNYSLAL
jgi:hypothetical protein